LAAGPLVSVHRPRGIAHHWQCKTCECDWDTFYRPSLV
jgi:MarR-like DNA-binding transcriptional regulator SgrR of sgrS sRNA